MKKGQERMKPAVWTQRVPHLSHAQPVPVSLLRRHISKRASDSPTRGARKVGRMIERKISPAPVELKLKSSQARRGKVVSNAVINTA